SIRTSRPRLAGKNRRSAARPGFRIGLLAIRWSTNSADVRVPQQDGRQDMKVGAIGPLALALTCLAAPAFAQASNDYCQGKSLTLVVGSPPAGGYDTYG